jgi:hypothetical protein
MTVRISDTLWVPIALELLPVRRATFPPPVTMVDVLFDPQADVKHAFAVAYLVQVVTPACLTSATLLHWSIPAIFQNVSHAAPDYLCITKLTHVLCVFQMNDTIAILRAALDKLPLLYVNGWRYKIHDAGGTRGTKAYLEVETPRGARLQITFKEFVRALAIALAEGQAAVVFDRTDISIKVKSLFCHLFVRLG